MPSNDGHCSEGRSATPPRKRVARAVTAPGALRNGVAKRKQAVCRRPGTSSRFRGVTHHCRTGRWEAHIWEEGKQVYLGGFDNEEQAALAYDIAAIKFRAHDANTNYSISNYEQELLHFHEVSKEEVVQSLRKQSRGAQKTSSQYRGVTKHMKGKWEARIGQMVGRKYKYLGLYKEEVEAAIAYDKEAVRRRGIHAITNFDLSEYIDLLDASSIKEAEQRHLFKFKAQAAKTVTPRTALGLYYTQATQPAGRLQQEQHHSADVQLVQTDMQQPHFDNAAHNLQQCGGYMVVNHPSDNPAGNYQYPDGSHMVAVYNDDPNSNSTSAVKWYGSLDSGVNHAALCSDAAQMGQPIWNGQQALQDAAVAKEGAPADVSRHDTPTSVFDIFNSLDISAATSTAPLAAQHQSHQHNTDFHGAEVVGQEAILTDLPHMTMHPHGYQAMITDDDDWLQDFATAQLQAEDSPESAPSGSEPEQAVEPTMSGNSNRQNTAGPDGEGQKDLDAAALDLGLQVEESVSTDS
ncbi:hypothetical protein ABBQ38_004520 [Trebouxia sp. C0009 RCD-2024]